MSADENTPLFVLKDEDKLNNEEGPAIIQVRENLAVAERLQQECMEQKCLERAQCQAEAEVEKLRQEVEEAEREWKELEEVEIKRLEEEKERLEGEKRAEEQHAVGLHMAEKVVEWRRVALAVPSPEAGPSRAPPWQPGRTVGQGSWPPRKTVHGVSHGGCDASGNQWVHSKLLALPTT